MLGPGEIVGRYRVDRHVATGAMAEVYLVRHLDRGTFHALKCLVGGSPRLHKRLQREARLQEQLSHPNVVTLTEVLDVRGSPGLVTEFVEGPTLAEHLRGRPLLPAEAQTLFIGVASGVAHAHKRGLVHRDVKPTNVLLARTPDGLLPKVADFGLAKALEPEDPDERLTASGGSVGSPWYMAPEQVRDPRSVDTRADVFSLGCVLYEMLTGQRAFPGTDPLAVLNAVCAGDYVPVPRLAPSVPPDVVAVVDRCLQVDPGKRFADARAVVDALGGPRSVTIPPGHGSPSRPWLFGGPPTVARVLASAGILATALAIGALTAWAVLG